MTTQIARLRNQRGLVILFILGATLFFDLITKVWARESLDGKTYSFLDNCLVFQHSENRGAFLSLGAGLDPKVRFWIFTVGIALLMVGLLYFLIRNRDLPLSQTIAYTLVTAGGMGNLADRVMKESVTDFINMGIGPIRTGVFNIADMAIMTGTFILIYLGFRKSPS